MTAATPRSDQPASVQPLAAALIALGMYKGKGGQAEHDAEAKRLGERLYQDEHAVASMSARPVSRRSGGPRWPCPG
jgi:hypothetical protein